MYQYFKFNNFHVVKVPLKEANKHTEFINAEKATTLTNMYQKMERKPTIMCNLGFFALGTNTSCFNLRCNNKDIAVHDKYQFGIAILQNGIITYGKKNSNCRDHCSGYPVLYDNYQPVPITWAKELDYKARRTIIGYNETDLFIIVVENSGSDYNDLQNLCGALGIGWCCNYDGGGSANLLINGKKMTTNDYDRPVLSFMCVYDD